MSINPFKLERYFALYEFKVQYLLSPSDCESLSMAELLDMAAPETRYLWENLKLGYTESPGHPLLRQEIVCLYQHISSDQVVVAAPEEAIFVTMNALLAPGDHIIAIAPAYQSLHEIARSIGCGLTRWELSPGPAGWWLDLDQLERSLTPHTRLLVINFPHNPTGYQPSREALDAIVAFARRHGLVLFSDEMYRLLEYSEDARLPAVCDLYEKGISLSGLSKAFALPGLRTGWLATQEAAFVERWLAFKDYTTICNSAPSEVLGIIALQAKERILKRNVGIVRQNLVLVEQFFREHATWLEWISPQAGSIAFPRWLGNCSVEQFCQEVLDQQGVMIVPGSIFDFPGSHFRIGLGRKNLSEGLARLGKYLEAAKLTK
jgi:aspartate/methionine/tyrosine aminotransferase